MKGLLLASMLLGTSVVHAGHMIEVTEPAFTADKIELNPVTNSYVVVNPKYFINARDAVKIVVDGLTVSITKTPKHLCRFLGMSGGNVISSSSLDRSKCEGQTLTIRDDGLYGLTTYVSSYYDCQVVDFLECSPK